MKNGFVSSVATILLWMGSYVLSSCQAVSFPEEEYPDSSENKLTVFTRSTNQEISYPIQVFAFDQAGGCVDSQLLTSNQESLQLHLPEGKFRIVALSGHAEDDLPAHPVLSTAIAWPTANYRTDPLSMGAADVQMGNSSQTLNVMMAHRVARLQVTLKHVPAAVTAVELLVSSPYSCINLQGEESDPRTATISCFRDGSDWSTGTFYLLPTSQSAVMTIRLTTDQGVDAFGYTYSGALLANTPYNITGTYTDGVVLEGSFLEQEWAGTVEQQFNFGPGAKQETKNDDSEQDEVRVVDEIPDAGTVWDGYVVADVQSTESGADVLLISKEEWSGLTSSHYTADPDVARQLADQYKEGDLTDWRIPTKEEAQQLMRLYGGNLSSINACMAEVQGTPLADIDSKSSAVRYLCEEAAYSFSWASGTKISQAGAKLNTYHLRLVHSVSLIVE